MENENEKQEMATTAADEVNKIDKEGLSLLMKATRLGQQEVTFLLAQGADVNYCIPGTSQTALNVAIGDKCQSIPFEFVGTERIPVIKTLLQSGIIINKACK